MAVMPEKASIKTVDKQELSVDKLEKAVDNPVDKAILADMKALNLENMTPMMALQKLYSYHGALKED